jgi:hypothetical protein
MRDITSWLTTGTALLFVACAGDLPGDVEGEPLESVDELAALGFGDGDGDGDGDDGDEEEDADVPRPVDCSIPEDEGRHCGYHPTSHTRALDSRIYTRMTFVPPPGGWRTTPYDGEPVITLRKRDLLRFEHATVEFPDAEVTYPIAYARLIVDGTTPGLKVDGAGNHGTCWQLVQGAQRKWECDVTELVRGWATSEAPRVFTLRNSGSSLDSISFNASESGVGPQLVILQNKFCQASACTVE